VPPQRPTVQALSLRSVPPPMPRSEFGSHAELLAALGIEKPFARRRWVFDLLTEIEIARLGAKPDAEKRQRLEALLLELALDGCQVQGLRDNIRVARWNGAAWEPGGRAQDRRIEQIMALYIDRKGYRCLSVVDMERRCQWAWDACHKAGVGLVHAVVPSPAND
jgi:hypothetical protein